LGRHLVYSRQIEDTNIWRAELPKNGDPPVEAELFISSTWVDQTPKYSPDGKKIAFISSRSGSREVWASNADSSKPVRLTFFNGPMTGHPSWSPDGQSIIFHARVEGTLDLFVVPAAGGPPKRLTTNTWEDHYPNYSRDGQWIFFSSRRSGEMQVWRMRADGSAPVQITTMGGIHNPAEAPDGRAVFYHLFQDPGEIWRIPVQGGEPVRIAGPTHPFPVGYTVTTEGLYYGAPPHNGEQRYIRFVNFYTGQNYPIVAAKRPFHSGMSVSPDSRYIIFDQYDETGSDLMLVQNFRLR
jgi:tricorn protease-like protein